MAIKVRAFTLIELLVVLSIMLLFSALTMPSLARQRTASEQRAIYPSLRQLVEAAREQAISTHTVIAISFDGASHSFIVQPPNQDSSGSTPVSSNNVSGSLSPHGPAQSTASPSAQNSAPASNSAPSGTLVIPSAIGDPSLQFNGSASTSSDWSLNFYPDGKSDRGAITLGQGTGARSLVIDEIGHGTWFDGTPPDPATLRWGAGDRVVR